MKKPKAVILGKPRLSGWYLSADGVAPAFYRFWNGAGWIYDGEHEVYGYWLPRFRLVKIKHKPRKKA